MKDKNGKVVLDKIKKCLTTAEQNTFNEVIKKMVKDKTDKNISLIKEQYEKKAQSIITEAKVTITEDNDTVIAELVEEEIADRLNKETSKQIKLIKESKKKDGIISSLNKSVEELKQSLKIQNNEISSLKKNTNEKEVLTESMMYGGIDVSKLAGIHSNAETTNFDQLKRNLSNNEMGNSVFDGLLASIQKY